MDQTNVLQASCPHCAAQMPETATYCPGCGQPMEAEERALGRVGPFPESIAGALAYFTFIPAIVFLTVEPYKKNRFVRFHSIQCVWLWVAVVLIAIALKLASLILYLVPVFGALLVWLIAVMAVLAAVIVWSVLVVKAFQGEMFQLPVLGDF